ncbi:cache domain-containing sensor histidine kinase [Paenibacillus methanolicus]|uniref:Two-component system sensor histidine kinase YesM n=1 Tax=Paenibacillus methanolicus TaxID=582686 RepID=A0A5S5BR90_9BACL|nr:sensor histidine kinase [Paenibacillus methanolicus]TYP68093.1 two-component system sensor histidine kinase YesM [Paenibacillus methanolicus]
MENWLGRSLKHKLSLLIIMATLVPLLSLGWFSYHIAEGLTEEKAKSAGMNTLRQLEAYLDTMVKDAENMSLFLIGHSGVQQYLKSPDGNYVLQTSIISFLTNLAFSKPYVANIIIEPLDAKRPISQRPVVRSEFTDITTILPDYYKQHPKWWSNVHRQWTTDGVRKVITLARPIRSTDKYKPIGKQQINLDQTVIANQVRSALMENSGFVLLLDEQNKLIAGPDEWETSVPIAEYYPGLPAMDGSGGYLDYGEGAEKKTVLYKRIAGVNWKLVGIIPAKEYRKQNEYFLTLTAVAVTVAMMFVIIFVVFLIQRITKPLSVLTRFLKSASPDEPLPALPVTSVDEVGQLVISYNKLSSRIIKLTEEVKRNESLKKEADMHALQVQINPHFLYNTLSSIHWLALMNQDGKIADMVGSLSDFLRFSLNKGQEYCAIQQELMHVQNYVRIQSIRYPEKFEFQLRLAEGIGEQTMLKLLLQPLVENAMLHGLLPKEGPGLIRITVSEEARGFCFRVEDDGAGMDEERMGELRAQLAGIPLERQERSSKQGSYGLRNVHNRLLLHYGKEAGLSIDSRKGGGTRVQFTLPRLSEAAAEQHDGTEFSQ